MCRKLVPRTISGVMYGSLKAEHLRSCSRSVTSSNLREETAFIEPQEARFHSRVHSPPLPDLRFYSMQLILFLLVGGCAVAVHYVVAVVLTEQLSLGGQVSNFIGFWSGFVTSYFGQSLLTFKATPSWINLLQYLLLAGFNYIASAAILYVLVTLLGVPYRISLLIVVSLLPLSSYIISRHIIFSKT